MPLIIYIETHTLFMIDDIMISRKIFERFSKEFLENLEVDVAIAGAGPSGLAAGKYLAEKNKKVVIFESKLCVGGGMWGGGMSFPVIVVQGSSKFILEEAGVKVKDSGDGYFTADSIESVSKLCSSAIDSGVKIFNGMSVEDVLIKNKSVNGFVINWSAVEIAKLHVDPLTMRAKHCVDATGHPAEVCRIVERKTKELTVKGESSMDAPAGEKTVVENTSEVYPGLYVAGMAANAVYGAPRMGPIFGGMLLSGKKVAEMILAKG